MSNRAKFVNGKLAGKIPSGKQAPDYETIFPQSFTFPDEMRDNYGNLCYELKNPGTEAAEFIRVDVEPTAEQVSAVRKRRIVQEMQKAGYDVNTEIAIIKDRINAGADTPEYTEMEAKREDIKNQIKAEKDGAILRSL